ncbi:hypothetical protein [Murimonas intestini]|uniref:Uncharacterized protein n=1 Tax=Murimonas intestini TaxID=1337051 RepID=A0AB73SZM2_9FIRM|nr:hypothetical protein [Murimonas intestini]MCR1842785.1 hypothetical protein [Murimonas intestini]MCR1867876.1 hypothetical protein [Murimonas intestini]MCR1885227.1 hypothetical protein [Murimonas intestini]
MKTDVLKEAWNSARSVRPGEPPLGIYVGSMEKDGNTYHFYYDTNSEEYYYETDYDRQQEKAAKERKKKRWKRAG